MAKIGQFIKASVAFHEEDGRSKVRPCLILAKARHGENMVYLCAPLSTQIGKTHGDSEIVLRKNEALMAGMPEESVIRLSRSSLVPVLDRDMTNVYGHVKDLPPSVQQAIKNAAKSLGCVI